VPALVVDADDVRWFGTIFGVARVQSGQFTPIPFDSSLSLPAEGVNTLEAFFREVAQALFDARPLSTAQIGDVSFIEEFGQPLIKQEVIFSVVEGVQERLWAGTLGGGLRRIEAGQDTLLLTRQEGTWQSIQRARPGWPRTGASYALSRRGAGWRGWCATPVARHLQGWMSVCRARHFGPLLLRLGALCWRICPQVASGCSLMAGSQQGGRSRRSGRRSKSPGSNSGWSQWY
jgi:hypothetical protein